MANFEFLRQYWPTLADIASLAESYLYTDPNSSIMKMGMFAERLVGEIFVFEKIPFPDTDDTQSARVRILKREGLLPATIDNLLYTIRKKRNDATHEYLDSGEDAKTILFMGYRLACWFMEVYGDWEFTPPQFVLPLPPVDYASILARKNEALDEANRQLLQKGAQLASKDAELASTAAQLASRDDALAAQQATLAQNATRLAAKEAEIAAKEAVIVALQDKITAISTAASATTRQQRQKQAEQTASTLDATEAEVRLIIDEQLRAAGWEVDTNNLRYSKGTRPVKGRNLIIAEWPTTADDGSDGRVDYAMFIGLQMVGMIEAKRPSVNIMSVLDAQCKDYATHLRAEDRRFHRGCCRPASIHTGRRFHQGWHQGISSETLLLRAEHLSVAVSHSVTAFIQQVQTVPLSHGYVAANGDGVGVVDNPVHDRIRRSALLACVSTDKPIPIIRFMLRAEDGRAHFRPRFNDVQKIKGLIHSQATLQPFIQDEKINGRIHLRDLLQHCAGISLNRGTGNHEFIQQSGNPDVSNLLELTARSISQSTGNICFATARRAG